MWYQEVRFRSAKKLFEYLHGFASNWIFRGHAEACWGLTSTLERWLGDDKWDPFLAAKCEQLALLRFDSRANLYLELGSYPQTKLGKLALMQHHGVPTRLLDFTESPFIALYFAIERLSIEKRKHGCIWALDYRQINKATVEILRGEGKSMNYLDPNLKHDEIFEQFIDQGSSEFLWVTEPSALNLRMERQRGTFILASRLDSKIADVLANQFADREAASSGSFARKIIFPSALSLEIFKGLGLMGLSSSRLFGDIDGLAREVAAELRYQILRRESS